MAKISPTKLSKYYSILRGVIRPEYVIQAEKKKKKKSGRTKSDADSMSPSQALSRLYSAARKKGAGKVMSDSDKALTESTKKKAAFLKKKLGDKKSGGRVSRKK